MSQFKYNKKDIGKHTQCEEKAARISSISDEAFFVLKLQRLTYYCDDSEVYRLLTCCGTGVDAEKFNLQLQHRCCLGTKNLASKVQPDEGDTIENNDSRSPPDEVDLFVPVRVRDVLFAYIIRFKSREPTYIIFSTAWQLKMEKWRLCYKQQVNSDGWHSGLHTMYVFVCVLFCYTNCPFIFFSHVFRYHIFRDELFATLKHLHPLQSDSIDWTQPIRYFNFQNHSLTISGLSAGCPLACMFVYDLLTREFPDYRHPIQVYLFGSPRFATPGIVQWFDSKTNQVTIHRIVNPMDPVPTLPTRKRGYCHVSPGLITPDCLHKPDLGGGLRFISCHGLYYGISFLSPTMTVMSNCVETFMNFWWIFLIIILVLFGFLLIIVFTAPRRHHKRQMKEVEMLVKRINFN